MRVVVCLHLLSNTIQTAWCTRMRLMTRSCESELRVARTDDTGAVTDQSELRVAIPATTVLPGESGSRLCS